jgi:hypothetical protein
MKGNTSNMQETDFYDELEELFAKMFEGSKVNKRVFSQKAVKSEICLEDGEAFGEHEELPEEEVISSRMESVADQYDEYWMPDAENGFLSH